MASSSAAAAAPPRAAARRRRPVTPARAGRRGRGLGLNQAVAEYLQWFAEDRHGSASSLAAYAGELGRFTEFAQRHLGDVAVTAVDRDLVHAYQRQVNMARSASAGRQLAARTRHRRLVALRSFLKFASREAWLPQELWMGVDLPKLPERLPKPLLEADRRRLEAMLSGGTLAKKRDAALLLFLLSTGARISEAVALDRRRWNPDSVRVIGKGDRERRVHLTARARTAMATYLVARQDPSPALFISFHPATCGQRDNRLTARGARDICDRLARELGLPHFSPHQLRHTLGTLLQAEVGDARLTAEVLGHAGLGTVMGYTKVAARGVKQAYRSLEECGL